jgi:hypothetical protein
MNLKIDKFKLIANGYDGIEVWRTEPVKKGSIITLDRVHRTRDIQLDKPLREKIQKLRYHFLLITRHWVAPYDRYFDHETFTPLPLPKEGVTIPPGQMLLRSLWNDTMITGAVIKPEAFMITGSIVAANDVKIGLSTPLVSSDDDYHFYMETYGFLLDICKDINEYLYSNLLPLTDAREQYMIENNLASLSKEDEEALMEKLIGKLHDQGAIIMMSEGGDMPVLEEIIPNREAVDGELHKSRNNMAPGRYQDSEEVSLFETEPDSEDDEDDGQIIYGENKGKVPNDFIVGSSEKGPENLSDMESSENMLLEDQWPE